MSGANLVTGLFGTLDSTNHLNLFADLMFAWVIIRFRVQFGINLHEWVFQKAEIARAAKTSAISAF